LRAVAGAAIALSASIPTFAQSSADSSDVVAILGATLFDATGAAPHVADIVISGGRIAEIGDHLKVPKGARIIHAKGKALLPGFFDLHTHWTPSGLPGTTPQIATAYLQSGVTSVNDFHQQPESYLPRREWLSHLATPHVSFAARVSTPGGHGADWGDQSTTIWINTPEAARAAVNSLRPYKPDLIKAFTDGWRYGASADNSSMDEATLRALSEEAHKAGLEVLTHTVTVDRGLVAARAGVDAIAHSLQDRRVDAANIAIIKASGMAIAPTLAVYEPEKPGKPPRDRNDPKVALSFAKFDNALYNVKALFDAGVPVAVGTDAGMPDTPHGRSTLRELELLVRAGLTPAQALIAGTATSAKVMHVDNDRGTVTVGKRADLILINGRPWENIGDVYKVSQVLVDGKVITGFGSNRADRLPSVTISHLVDDFERADGRSSLDTLRLDTPDGGMDRTAEISQIVPRENGGKALLVSARMAQKDKAYAGVAIPLTRGSVQPVDLRRFDGVRFDVKGAGDYTVRINGLDGRWIASFTASDDWTSVELPFSALHAMSERQEAGAVWTADGITQIEFGASRAPGDKLWFLIDNVQFY
jgi:imidazolonepropionase-like amidohydrolase